MKTKLVPLFDNSYFEIKKHSSIVQMSNVATLQERKVMNALLWIAKDNLKRSPNDRVFTTDLWILKRLTGIKKNDNVELKEALRHLSSMAIEYNIMQKDNTNEWGIFRFISEVKIREEWVWKSTNISFEFPTSILETIKKPNMFVKLDLMIIRGLESKHSIVLYEFLKDYLKLGKLRCSIVDFRKLMWIQEKQYLNFTMLKKRTLDIAVDEINKKTDIVISYKLEKFWRTTTSIFFTMHTKDNHIDDNLETTLRGKLKLYGVKPPIIDTLIKKHDLEYLSANLRIVEEQIKKWEIQNITWYLLKAFKIDYRVEETPFEIESSKKKELRKIELEKQKEESKQKESIKKEEKRIKDEQAKAYLESISDEQKKVLWDNFILSMSNNIIFARILAKHWTENSVVENERLRYIIDKEKL